MCGCVRRTAACAGLPHGADDVDGEDAAALNEDEETGEWLQAAADAAMVGGRRDGAEAPDDDDEVVVDEEGEDDVGSDSGIT